MSNNKLDDELNTSDEEVSRAQIHYLKSQLS
jgi:hypothetical protein